MDGDSLAILFSVPDGRADEWTIMSPCFLGPSMHALRLRRTSSFLWHCFGTRTLKHIAKAVHGLHNGHARFYKCRRTARVTISTARARGSQMPPIGRFRSSAAFCAHACSVSTVTFGPLNCCMLFTSKTRT